MYKRLSVFTFQRVPRGFLYNFSIRLIINIRPPNQVESITRDPVKIQIVSSAENTPLIEHDLNELLSDATSCDYSSYVDDNGMTYIKIECMVSEEEKERVWDLIRFKHRRDCNISSEPKMFYE
jgi:hypothetical protein